MACTARPRRDGRQLRYGESGTTIGGTMTSRVQVAAQSIDSDSAAPDRELGGVGLPAELFRAVTLDGTVVLAADQTSPDAEPLRTLAAQQGWRLVDVADADAAGWATTIQKTSLVLVAAVDVGFTVGVLNAIRRSTSAPAVAVGVQSSAGRVRALQEGADIVLPSGLAAEEMYAHLVALLRRA